jgi:hypothetical protein
MHRNEAIQNDISTLDSTNRLFTLSPWLRGVSRDRLCRWMGAEGNKSLKITVRQTIPLQVRQGMRPMVNMGVNTSADRQLYAEQKKCDISLSVRFQCGGKWHNHCNWNETIPNQIFTPFPTPVRLVHWIQFLGASQSEMCHIYVCKRKEDKAIQEDDHYVGVTLKNLNVYKFPIIVYQSTDDWSGVNYHWD